MYTYPLECLRLVHLKIYSLELLKESLKKKQVVKPTLQHTL